jgi:hypothetical protein
MPKTLIGWGLLIVVIILIAKNPAGIGHWAHRTASSIATFVGSAASG